MDSRLLRNEESPKSMPLDNNAGWTDREVSEHMELICRSLPLCRAARRSKIFRYLVAETLAGRTPTERDIARHVYKKPGFDPSSDAIVRGQIRELRANLLSFYAAEGEATKLRFTIPEGQYGVDIHGIDQLMTIPEIPGDEPANGGGLDRPLWFEKARAAARSSDTTETASCLRKAAEAGEAVAMPFLGLMILNGRGGLIEDEALALYWFRRAADQQDPQGMAFLAGMYASGRGGVSKDQSLALSWTLKAAELGGTYGMMALGLMHASGRGELTKDHDEAKVWFSKALAAAQAVGLTGLGTIYAENSTGLPNLDAQAVLACFVSAISNFEIAVVGGGGALALGLIVLGVPLLLAPFVPAGGLLAGRKLRKLVGSLLSRRLRALSFSEELLLYLELFF